MTVAEDQKERFDKKRFWRRPRMRLCRVTKSKWKRQLVKSNRAALREDSVPAALFTDCLTCLPSSLWSATLAIKSPPRKHEKSHLVLGLAFPISCDAPGHSSSPTFEGLLERPVLVWSNQDGGRFCLMLILVASYGHTLGYTLCQRSSKCPLQNRVWYSLLGEYI